MSADPLYVLAAEPVVVKANSRNRAVQMYRNYLRATPFTVRLAECPDESVAHDVREQVASPLPDVDDTDEVVWEKRPRVFILGWASGDWFQAYFNDRVIYEGHTIPEWVWLRMLELCGAEIVAKNNFQDDNGDRCFMDNLSVLDVPDEDLSTFDLSDLLTDTVGAE